MTENADNQNMVQNFSGAASHGVTNAGGGGGILSTPGSVVNKDDFWRFPIGFRFVPTDIELIRDYLMKKVKGEPLSPNPNFHEANIYDSNPDQLCQEYKQSDGGKEWYFFSPRFKKYPNGGRPNRETGNRFGFWKVTGVRKLVTLTDGSEIGFKWNLDFYQRQVPDNKKTNWKMHEYQVIGKRLSSQGMTLDECVLCKIYLSRTKKGNGKDKESEEEDHCPDTCSSPSTARNMGIMPTYGSYNQYSNACFSQMPLMPDSSSSMAGNNNIMHASQNHFMAGSYVQGVNTMYALTPACLMSENHSDFPFQNDFHGGFFMDGFDENHCSSWDPYLKPLPEDFLQVQHPNVTSFGAMNNEGSLIAAGNDSNNINVILEGCNSVATHPHDNVQLNN